MAASRSNRKISSASATPRKNSRGKTRYKKARTNTASQRGGDPTLGSDERQGAQAMAFQNAEEPAWVKLSDEQLLDLRVCDLQLDLESTPLVACRDQLHQELKDRGLRLRPHCWFSDDWFSPDGIPGIAIPFYMAHRRLMRLERSQMLEVEGGTKEWCMQILRHEAGHTLDTAFRLHRRKGYREHFGNYSAPYPETYRPRPRSKKFVQHLAPWYAQSHPAEDFAETFAVWLTPGMRWRKQYRGWAALKKLEFVDQLMQDIAGQSPKVISRAKVDPAHRINKTLREHYELRQATYCVHEPSVFDEDLRRLFSSEKPVASKATGSKPRAKTAAAFMQRHRRELCQTIGHWTGEYRYNINQVLREMTERCRFLKLYVDGDEAQVKQDLLILLTMHTMNYLHAGHRVAL